MSCFVKHLSTYDANNYIHCRSGEDSRRELLSSLLQATRMPENNDGYDDEDERINVKSGVQSDDHNKVEEPRFITRFII